MKKLRILPAVLACLTACMGFFGCKTQGALSSGSDGMNWGDDEGPRPELLFVMGSVVHDSVTDECRLNVTDVTHVYGEAKLEMATEVEGDRSFSYDQIGAGGRILSSRAIENPLVQTLEFSYEDGHFERKTIVRDSADFFVRIQLDLKARSITFNYKKKPIGTVKLSNYKIQ